MPSTNMEFGLDAEKHVPGPSHKGVFWYSTDTATLEFCDGTAWLPAGGGGGGLPVGTVQVGTKTDLYGFSFASLLSDNDNASELHDLFGGSGFTLNMPVLTNDQMVIATLIVPAPEIVRNAYAGAMEIIEWASIGGTFCNDPFPITKTTVQGSQPDPMLIDGVSSYYTDYSLVVPGQGHTITRMWRIPAGQNEAVKFEARIGIRAESSVTMDIRDMHQAIFSNLMGYQAQNVANLSAMSFEVA